MSEQANEEDARLIARDGLPDDRRHEAAALFWSAFRHKLHRVMQPSERALRFLTGAIDPSHAISVVAPDGRLLGVAGYKTRAGAFVNGSLSGLRDAYGWFGGPWRGLMLSVLERPLEPNTLLMDGIFVAEAARGRGIGSLLLAAVKRKALAKGCDRVRLDVVQTNARARALYERHGFIAVGTKPIGPFSRVFGFSAATTMLCQIDARPEGTAV